jgi:hypothetical protein
MMESREFLVADYSNEDPGKILDSYSLIEAIHELFDPTTPHNLTYLQMRITLLRETFNLSKNSTNEHIDAIDRLVEGYGRVSPVALLPFEGAMEVPDSIDTEAHIKIEAQFESDFIAIRGKAYAIQRAYITYIIIHAIEGRLRSKKIALADLIASGLPQSDPGQDDDDW